MRTHVEEGCQLLADIDFGAPIADIVYQIHERYRRQRLSARTEGRGDPARGAHPRDRRYRRSDVLAAPVSPGRRHGSRDRRDQSRRRHASTTCTSSLPARDSCVSTASRCRNNGRPDAQRLRDSRVDALVRCASAVSPRSVLLRPKRLACIRLRTDAGSPDMSRSRRRAQCAASNKGITVERRRRKASGPLDALATQRSRIAGLPLRTVQQTVRVKPASTAHSTQLRSTSLARHECSPRARAGCELASEDSCVRSVHMHSSNVSACCVCRCWSACCLFVRVGVRAPRPRRPISAPTISGTPATWLYVGIAYYFRPTRRIRRARRCASRSRTSRRGRPSALDAAASSARRPRSATGNIRHQRQRRQCRRVALPAFSIRA